MTISEKRAQGLAIYDRAAQHGIESVSESWEEIAAILAGLVPRPKPKPATGAEWCEYTPAQHKGRGKMFHANCSALFAFSDGVVIAAPIRHRVNMDMPDWARAMRCAVRFYRLKLAKQLLEDTGGSWGCIRPSREEEYAASCRVPEIVDAVDETRGVVPDIARLNESTADIRNGQPFDGCKALEFAEMYGRIAA
jgi:hypothetical protein